VNGQRQGGISVEALRRRVLSVPTLVALLVGAALFGFVLWRVFDFDWSQLWDNISGISVWKYLLAMAAYYASFWFRGLRWRLIAITANIDGQDGRTVPGACKMGAIILMGWFANSVAFLRLGDALRGWTLSRESDAPFSASLGTVLAERVQDMVAVLALVLVATVWVTVSGNARIPGEVVIAAAVLVAVLIGGLVAMRLFGLRASQWLPLRFQEAYARFQSGTLDSFRSTALPLQLTLGIIGWLLEIARFYFVADALGLDIGFGVVMFAALANAMLTTIPTPGGFGFVEGGLTGLLILLGVEDTDGLSLTVVDRSISWLSVVVFGGALFFIWHYVKRGTITATESAPPPPVGPGDTKAPSTQSG
jgi:uncharacterized protein (TIRG00374 family)